MGIHTYFRIMKVNLLFFIDFYVVRGANYAITERVRKTLSSCYQAYEKPIYMTVAYISKKICRWIFYTHAFTFIYGD